MIYIRRYFSLFVLLTIFFTQCAKSSGLPTVGSGSQEEKGKLDRDSLGPILPSQPGSEQASFCLFPVGGGITDDLIRAFIKQSPKENPTVLLIPQASEAADIEAVTDANLARFKRVGVSSVEVLDASNLKESLAKINNADAIWIPGGYQTLMMTTLRETGEELIENIQNRYNNGQVIVGGTSAGASALSEVMIPIDRNPKGGLGLWPKAIIHQHFTERNRKDILKEAVSKYPDRIGIGIDEFTAVVYTNNKKLKVVGRGTVTILQLENKIWKEWILRDGEIFNLN